MRENRIILIHEADLPLFWQEVGNICFTDHDAAAVRMVKTRDQLEQQGLSGCGRSQDYEVLPLFDMQIDVE